MPVPLTAREPVEFTPPTLPERLQGKADDGLANVIIYVRVPTMFERDTYSAALVRGGVMHYTRNQIRDLARAGILDHFPHDKHDEYLALLEELYAVADEESRVEREQQKTLLELYQAEKDKRRDPKAVPDAAKVKKALDSIKATVTMDKRRRIKATAISQEVMGSFEPLTQALAGMTEQDKRRAWLNAEVYVTGWRGLDHSPEGNGRGGLLKHEVEYLRGQIGEEAFDELSDFITMLQGIDEDEEKNLASLLASMSDPTGSTQSESSASSEDGNSTDGPSTSTQGDGSPKTTGSSSSSTSSSRTKGARSGRRSRTGKA